ncbi:MAG: Gfo/Idh/MocA family oxidoreductase [Oscillospiraceae bacterium]|jgi:predicted dehydrogenase|nr:Gfo/Idh/MocA family oxidoreductase [Oscillospiraceae bacterium]
MKTVKIGIVGIGKISGIYLKNITNMFKEIEIAGVCDLIRERAEEAVEEYSIPKLYKDMHELFADPEVDIVLNLTRPYEHYEVSKAALEAGKYVYSEKPLGATLDEGKKLVALAKEKGLMICGAPDTFMGAGIQTCRKLIEGGFIGQPVGASGFFVCRGHERWHPDPEFYYKFGGGPVLDMGPYYLTAMMNLLGGINTVSAMAKKSFDQRTITSEPKFGNIIDVDVTTYVTGSMMFDCGAIGTFFTTFDVWDSQVPRIEIYGTEGTLSVPDPNIFGGTPKLLRPNGEFTEIPLSFNYAENSRGLGVADLAKAITTGRRPRASMEQYYHALEVMMAFQKSSDEGKHIAIESKYTPEKPMVYSQLTGVLD